MSSYCGVIETTYVAYGLRLRSTFVLAGLRPRAEHSALPCLLVRRAGPLELDAQWSGPAGPEPWRGTLGDRSTLTIEHGRDGDVLFTYGDRARFRLDPTRSALDCAPAHEGLHWQQVLLGRIIPNVSIECGYEALHASAVESPHGVVAVAAPSGMGKTTLARELMRRDWPLFADDVLTLDTGPGGVRAHPGTPLMNVAADGDAADAEALGRTLGVISGERWLAAGNVSSGECPVAMVCMLERRSGLQLDLRSLPPNPLPLAPYMLGLSEGPERERSRFGLYCDLVDSAQLARITCDPADPPELLADLIERALRERRCGAPAQGVG